jgi:hypothetical protein
VTKVKPAVIVVDDGGEFLSIGWQCRLVRAPTENRFARLLAFPGGHSR